MKKRLTVLAMFVTLLAAPLRAAGPEDTVRWIYDSLAGPGAGPKGLAYLAAPDRRAQYFTARLTAWFEVDDTYRAENLPGCWPHMFDLPTAGADPAEIARTLTLSSTYAPDGQTVTASFSSGGKVARISYAFRAEDGFLRIDDITGPDWQVSRIACAPWGSTEALEDNGSSRPESGSVPAYNGDAARYCYLAGGDRLRLEVEKDGSARLDLVSRQPTGQNCEARGAAQWTGQGWVLTPPQDAGDCRLEILLTPDRGLRLRDRDFTCKPWLCGPRAVLDGLVFGRGDQVNCTLSGFD